MALYIYSRDEIIMVVTGFDSDEAQKWADQFGRVILETKDSTMVFTKQSELTTIEQPSLRVEYRTKTKWPYTKEI